MESRILVVDDEPANIAILGDLLTEAGYTVLVALNGEQALDIAKQERPNLILLDVVMPGMNGYQVCQALREKSASRHTPVILVTGERPEEERIRGLDAGADEFLTKPINREELLARVRSLLRVEALHREIETQSRQLADWNEKLETRVQKQVAEMARLNELKNFLPERVAEVILEDESGELLQPRRRSITACVIDLRDFTPFAESAKPYEIITVLTEFFTAMGEVVDRHQGTVEYFAGDNMTIFFNAPLEIDSAEEQAVRAALGMREAFSHIRQQWRERGHDLGLGIGLAHGESTIGAIGFHGRWQYAAIGDVPNLAARLCALAKDGEILITERLCDTVECSLELECRGAQDIRGFSQPVAVKQLCGLNT